MTFEEYLKQQKEQPEQQQGSGRIATFDQYLKQQEQNAAPAMKQKFYAASGMDDFRRDFHAYNQEAIDAVSSGLESAQRKCSAQGRQWRTNLAKQRDYFDRYAKYFSEEELTSIREELDSYEAVLNDFDLITGNQVKLPPPDLSTQAPKAPFNMASDPFNRKASHSSYGIYEYDHSLDSYKDKVNAALQKGLWQEVDYHLRQMAQEDFSPEDRDEAVRFIEQVTDSDYLHSVANSMNEGKGNKVGKEAQAARAHILDLADRGNWEELYNLMHSMEGKAYKQLLRDGYGIDADSIQSRENNYMGLVSQLELGDEYGFEHLVSSGESYKTILGTTAFMDRARQEVQKAQQHEGSKAQMDSFTRAQTAYYVLDQLYDELGFGTDSVVTADNARTRYLLKFLKEKCGVDLTGINTSNGAEMIRMAQEEQGNKSDLMNRTLKEQGYDTEVVRLYMENTVQQGLAEEEEKAFKEFWENASAWEKIGMNILSVPHKVLVSPLVAATQLGAMGGKGSDTDDPNTYVPRIAHTDGATRIRIATDDDIKSDFWSFVYNAGMSAADSAANAMSFGKGATFFMSLAGAGETANEILARGGSREQALRGGIAAGAIEALTEHFSIDQLLKGADSVTGLKSLMKAVGMQSFTEGTEEMSSEILNLIVDSANMGNLSQNSLAVEAYMNEGLSYDQARSRVFLDNITQVAESGLAGSLSGGMSAGGFGAPRVLNGHMNRRAFEADRDNRALQIYGAEPEALVAEALKLDPNNAFAQKMKDRLDRGKKLSGSQIRQLVMQNEAIIEELGETEVLMPDWEQYEQEHAGERFTRDRSGDVVDQTEDMELWREDTFEKAQEYSDEKLQQQIEEYRAKRDDSSQDEKSREIAQYHLDALEYTQMERQNNNAALNEQREEGVNYSGAEGLDDSSQRPAGLGTEGQTGSMAESTSRSVPRGKGKTEKAIVDDIRANAATQSSREIGIIGGSTTADLRVIPAERIGESESWSRIRDEVEARGQKLVLVVGRMETVDPVTKKVYAHEGIRQVAADGSVTYYIKADKLSRSAEQIYKHEDFHDIVHNNPDLLPGLVDALEEQYGKQELMSLIYSYVEAFDGVYGTFEDGMTEEAERALAMKYAGEIFADAYGEINRVRRNTTGAKKILKSQSDSVQRAAQNRKATEQKTAPPGQLFSIERIVEGEKGIYENCVVLDTDLFNNTKPRYWKSKLGDFVYNNLAGQRLTMFDENGNAETVEVARTDDRVKKSGAKNKHRVIDKIARYYGDNIKALATVHLSELLTVSDRESRSDEKNHQWMDENGWIYRHVFIVNRDGVIYDALLNIADGRDRRIIYEINNIRAIDKRKGTAHGVVPSTENGRGSHIKSSSSEKNIQQKEESVKQNFSVDDEAYLGAVEDGDMETAQRMVDEAAKKAGFSVRAYHGTPNGTFHEFREWQYFTEDKEYADTYQNQSASVNYKKTATNPRTYDVFLRPGNAFDTRQARERRIFETQFYRQWGNGAPLSDRGLPDWTDGDDLVEFFEEEGYDYTAILLDEGGTGGYGEEVKDRGISYVIKSSEQIKSANPVTYDDNGNVIPLSQRFNEDRTDIRYSVDDEARELDAGYARRMEEDDAPEGLPSEEEALEQYYHKAREEKERRAQSAPIHTLRSRVKSSERAISLQRELKAEMRKIGALSEEAARNIDARIELIRETMQIDKAALMEKEKLRKAEERKRAKEKKEAEIVNQKARTAQKELKQDLLNLFSVREGTRLELGELIDKFSDKLLQQGSLSHEDRKELFDALMDHGEKLAYPEEYFQNVRSYMTQGRIYVNESVRAEFGDDWKAFQNRAWGNRIFLTSDQSDMGIDVWTMALKTEFGGQFDGENDLKTQLEMIVDLAEEGKAEKLTIAEMMQRESEEFGWSVEEQMEELESKVDKLLDIFAQKADLEVRLRQQSLRQRMKDYDLYRTTLERKRAAAMETQARKNVMAAIQKLNKMRKRASPEHRKAIDEALKGIDVVARSISARGLEDLQELKRLYLEQQAKEEANFLRSPYVEARLDRLDNQQLDNMSIEDVVELGRVVCSITNAIQNSKKLLADARNQEVEQAAREVDQEIWESEGSKDGKLRKLTLNHLDAKRFFGQISGWANGTFERLGQELSTGQERQMRYQMNAMRIFDSFLAKKENQKWLKTAAGSEAQWIKVSVPSGFKITKDKMSVITSEIEITPMMRISLLLHSMNEDNLRHIKEGGILIPVKEQYQKGKMKDAYARGVLVMMDPATVRAIVKNCTEQEKAFARLCESYFNGMAKDCINEVSMVLDGFERAGGEHYYHIKTDPDFLNAQNDTIKRDLSVAATASVVNERKHASNPIVLQDATDALMEHIESISKYYGYSVPLRDLNAVLGQVFHVKGNAFSGSVMKTLKQKWGESAKKYIDKLSADLQLPDSSKDYMTDFAVKLRGNYAKAVISANLSSLMKQTTSFPVALPYLKMGGLIHGLKLQSMKQDVKTLEKYSAVYWYRNQGNATTELSDVLKRREFGDALPWVFNATQKMDSWTTRRILAGCEYRVQKDMGLKPGTEAEIAEGTDRYWCEVAKLFNDVVLKTQSNSTMMERPQITRANAGNLSRFLTMFRTDSYQQYNMLVEAAGRLRAAKKEYKANGNTENKKALANARKFAARTVIGTLTGQIGCAFVGVLLKNLRFDDEEFRDENGEWDWGAVADYVGRGVVESYCGFLTCGEWLYAAVEVAIDDDKRWWDAEVNALGMVNDAVTEGLNLIRDLKTGDFLKGRKAIKDTAFAFSKMFGIPAENLEKYLYMCARWFAPEFVAKRENWWDEITKADLSKESRKTIHEAISVLLDNRTSGMSAQDKEEIARLYLSGGVGAVPAGIPTSISYTDEQGEQITVELSPSQQGEYRELWREIVSPAIGDLLASDVYAEAKDEGKTALIDKLYKYAASSVAHELVPDKEIDKWVIQGDTAQDNGISLADYIAFRVELSEVSGKDTSGDTVTCLKARKSMELIEAMGWSDKQEKAIWLDVVASNSSAAITKALTKAGLNWNQVNDIVVMTGNKVDKMAAITATGQSDSVKVKAMSVFASDLEKKLLAVGLRYGIKPEWYTEVLKNANTDGKGGVSQKEAHEYIMGMGLTLQEETVLFQMVTDAKEGKSNPFYQWYAEEFYYEVHKDDPE
ncbi:MAG: hypothetical protein J6K89_04055 [Oscillospiraceae bacterium]|nr:hypothetical protein [Oscillospiraceae bacterium]